MDAPAQSSTLPRRRLGKTDMEITRVGFGAWAIPMQAGLLTGRFSAERAASLPSEDWRSRNGEFRGDKLERNLALAEAMKPIAERHGTTVAAVAVAWTLAWPAVSGAIVGARSPEQVDGWLDAATLALTKQDVTEIATAIERTGAGKGPTSPA
jgi:aryl-alcohol dehydrogenase-like predicted oxidoreductase